MKAIDAHVHIGTNAIYEFKQSAEDIIHQMKTGGIEKSVLFPFADLVDIDESNKLVTAAVHVHPDSFIGMYCLNPWDGNAIKTIEEDIVKSRASGLFLDAEVYSINLLKPAIQTLFAKADEYEWPVLIHSDHPRSRANQELSAGLKTIATKFPNVKIIVRATIPGIAPLATNSNVFLETSLMSNNRSIESLVLTYGARKIIFGSGSPVDNPYTMRQIVELANITDFERELIFNRNIQKILEH